MAWSPCAVACALESGCEPVLRCPPRLATCGPGGDDEQATASRTVAAKLAAVPQARARRGGRDMAAAPVVDLRRFIVGLQRFSLECLPAQAYRARGYRGRTRSAGFRHLPGPPRPRGRRPGHAVPVPGERGV